MENTLVKYRYFIVLSYNGSAFHGWQIQPNATTVQGVLNNAVSTLLNEEISITGCGRTDTGVHAKNFVGHFDSSRENLHLDTQFTFKLNRFLPRTISIHRVSLLHSEAHSRFDANSRTYRYYLSTEKDPFMYPYQAYGFRTPDIEIMNKAAEILKEYIDFTSFSKLDTDVKTNNCVITKAEWTFENRVMIFTITADRFLRNMVRAIVGTLIEVGQNKLTLEEFRKIIEAKDRCAAGASAPGNALFLEEIKYPYSF